jgi:hypothetical protein
MSTATDRRLAAGAGLALAAAVALWWLGSTRLALDHGADASRSAADALQALWLARALLLATLGLRAGALQGWRGGSGAALALTAPAWPVVVLAWSASSASPAQAALAEAVLLAGSLALPLAGRGLQRLLPRAGFASVLATALGAALAAAVWLGRSLWALPAA